MALAINRTYATRTTGSETRNEVNLVNGDILPNWSEVASGGGGFGVLPVENVGALNGNWVDCEVTVGGTGRSILDIGVTVAAGKRYWFIFEAVGSAGLPSNRHNITLTGGFASFVNNLTPSSGYAIGGDGFYAIRMDGIAPGNITLRMGLGCNTFADGPEVLGIRNVAVMESDLGATIPPENTPFYFGTIRRTRADKDERRRCSAHNVQS